LKKTVSEKLSPERYVARFRAEKAVLSRHYCNLFAFWRACPLKQCRRDRRCSGDPNACLKRRGRKVPREVQWQARQQIIVATPADTGAPERAARELMPGILAEKV
jgi:hypothetical protein